MLFCQASDCSLMRMLPAGLQEVASLEHLRARVGGSELRVYAWGGERGREEEERRANKRRAREQNRSKSSKEGLTSRCSRSELTGKETRSRKVEDSLMVLSLALSVGRRRPRLRSSPAKT